MLKGIFLLNADAYGKIYGDPERKAIEDMVDIYAPLQTAEMVTANPGILSQADVIFSGWGMVKLEPSLLAAAPRLQVVFYGSGSIRGFTTEEAWDRGITICSAYAANAVPVVEYTLSQILFSLKRGWYYASATRTLGHYPEKSPVPGGYGSTVGIISLGMIGRMVVERLRSFDLQVLAYDPFVTEEQGAALGVTMCSLEDLFRDIGCRFTPHPLAAGNGGHGDRRPSGKHEKRRDLHQHSPWSNCARTGDDQRAAAAR